MPKMVLKLVYLYKRRVIFMKKFLALFLALSCVISITGCSEQDKKFVET